MYQNIITGSVGTAAARLNGRITNFKPDGLLVRLMVGGTAHAWAVFDSVVVDATMRNSRGGDINVFSNVRLSDLFKLSDFLGGFSATSKTGAGEYYIYVPLGKLVLSGDDSLEVSVSFPGHATATYGVRVTAVDNSRNAENVKGYESVTGSGLEVFMKDVNAAYLMDAADGSTFPFKDQEYSEIPEDYDAVSYANAVGETEQGVGIGILYEDTTKLSQDLRIKVPTGKHVFFVKSFFPVDRVTAAAAQVSFDVSKVVGSIEVVSPDKHKYLKQVGAIK
jgi:hypothetical protein